MDSLTRECCGGQNLKIVIPTPFPELEKLSGGQTVHVYNLAKWLARIPETEVTIVTLGTENLAQSIGGAKVIVLKRRPLDRYFPFVRIFQIRGVVRKENPDVLHLHGNPVTHFLLYALFFAPRKTPKMITIHGRPAEEFISYGYMKENSLRSKVMKWADRRIATDFDRIVFVGSNLKSEFQAKVGSGSSSKFVVIPNGVDVDLFAPGERSRSFGQSSEVGRPVVLNAKALAPFNGQEYLVQAFRTVVRQLPNASLLLVGGGPDRPRLERAVSEAGLSPNVHFLGELPYSSMPDLLLSADIAVLPSVAYGGIQETSGLFALEAMATGKPVIASNLGGLRETIVHGRTGLLVQEKDADSIASAIIYLWKNPQIAAEIAAAGRAFVSEERSWKKVASLVRRLYSDVVSEKSTQKNSHRPLKEVRKRS